MLLQLLYQIETQVQLYGTVACFNAGPRKPYGFFKNTDS